MSTARGVRYPMTRVNHATRGVSQLGLSCEARNHRYRVNPEGARARWGLSQVVHPCTSIDTWQRDVIGEGKKEREKKRKKERKKKSRVEHTCDPFVSKCYPSADRRPFHHLQGAKGRKKEMLEGSHALGTFFRTRLSATVSPLYSSLRHFFSLFISWHRMMDLMFMLSIDSFDSLFLYFFFCFFICVFISIEI